MSDGCKSCGGELYGHARQCKQTKCKLIAATQEIGVLRAEVAALKSRGWTYVKDGLPVDEAVLYDVWCRRSDVSNKKLMRGMSRISLHHKCTDSLQYWHPYAWRIHREEVAPPLP